MTILLKLPPHLTTDTGRADAAAAIRKFADDECVADPVSVVPVQHLGYVSVQLLDYAALVVWTNVLREHADFHVADHEAHGWSPNEAWGWIAGHHVNLWFCGTTLAAAS